MASWVGARSPANGTPGLSFGMGSGVKVISGLILSLATQSGVTLLQAPQSPSSSPRSIAIRCWALPA